MATVLVAAVAVVVTHDSGTDTATGDPPGTERTTRPVPTPTTEPTRATTTVPTTAATAATSGPAQRSADEALAGFFAAASTLDTQLHDAATAINGAGPPWPTVTETISARVLTSIRLPDEVATAVQTARLAPVAEAIPAGLPRDLQEAVILVYSDLSSRRHAMDNFGAATAAVVEGDGADTEHLQRMLLEDLRSGGIAAARFDDDVADARSTAASSSPVPTSAPDARPAAERALLIGHVEGANTACGTRGGAVVDDLPVIDWTPGTVDGSAVDGTIGSRGFTIELGADHVWDANVMFC